MLQFPSVNVTIVKGELAYEATTDSTSDKKAVWGKIQKHKKSIIEYLKTFDQASTLSNYIDGGEAARPRHERIAKMPILKAMVESMRITEKFLLGQDLSDKIADDRRVFLDAFPGFKTYQTFDDNADRKLKTLIRIIHDKAGLGLGTKKTLENLNRNGAGVYMTINETDGHGRKLENITQVRACFSDFDGAPLSPVWDYEPSMVVETSPGKYHAFFLVDDDFPLEGFTQLQEAIAATFSSDPKVKDLPRIMRVPGFCHHKAAPFLTRIIHYSGEVYSFGRLTELFPPAKAEMWSAEKYQKPKEWDSHGEFTGVYGASSGNRNCHLAKRAGGMISRGLQWNEIEIELHKEGQACAPPLRESEIQAVIKSLRRYA